MLAPGSKIGGYEVITPLRSGGMAMLYLARRRGLGGFSRLVALKLVHAHLADDESIKRLFLQEARIAASVAHPNVVNVEEVGKADGHYFIAMEYVHGVSLAELVASLQKRRLRMSSKLCVWMAAHVAEALHAAHEAAGENGLPLHIVHRDVSPQNILIGHNGHVKLIDFGIAKSHSLSRHVTGGSTLLGKLGYMAPEQLQLGPVDRRTDVYALGVTLWEMLCSRNLFRSIRVDDELDWTTRECPPAPSRYSPLSTQALDRVVCRAIAFDRAARYANALEFRAALLQAWPSAAEVDALKLAGLMRNVLGDELSRRQASWPREVTLELDLDAQRSTGRGGLNIEELTTKLRSSGAPPNTDEEDSDEPTTVIESPNAARAEGSRSAGPQRAARSQAQPPIPSTAIPTPRLGVAAATLNVDASWDLGKKRHVLLASGMAALCVSLATVLAGPSVASRATGRRVSARLEQQHIGAHAQQPRMQHRPALAERSTPISTTWPDAGELTSDLAVPQAAPQAPLPDAAEETAAVVLTADAVDPAAAADAAVSEQQDAPRARHANKPASRGQSNSGSGKKSSGAAGATRVRRRPAI